MPNLQDEAKAYIESVLGVAAQMTPVPLRVPYTIRDSYKTYELSVPLGTIRRST